ncbi:NAD(P)-binding domain-containing protein [Microbacterium awajiense]|uniref:NAD(P)-binding domain-containing protein n=1 Tax=Microbacterium awajiense TaxID=415214 RepID=A0ABP7B129_9MICO
MTLIELSPPASQTDRLATLPVVVIGAGPVGLAAAAQLIERGIDVVVLERGSHIAESVRAWGHVRLFSPWRHLVDPAARRMLEAAGWQHPDPDAAPTGAELVEQYLEPLARLDAIAAVVRLDVDVVAVAREGMDRTRTRGRAAVPFAVRVRGADGVVDELPARAVIDASGTFTSPNPLTSSGLELLGADEVSDLVTGPLPDVRGAERARFAGRRVTVVGAGHSAANTLLALVELAREAPGTEVRWLIRNTRAARVTTSPDDELVDRAALGSRLEAAVARGDVERIEGFEIVRARRVDGAVELVGRQGDALVTHTADIVVGATGFRPDLGMLRELRLELDDIVEAPRRLAPLIDPNVHSCGTVEPHGYRELQHPEPGFFVVGMKSYGRAPTFLLATGYEQVRSVAALIAGDAQAAASVELVLPATGVCSTGDAGGQGGCCA